MNEVFTNPGEKLKDSAAVEHLLGLVQAPHNEHRRPKDKARFPPDWASQIEISCSS